MRRNTITTASDQYATCICSIRIERDMIQLQARAITNVTRRDLIQHDTITTSSTTRLDSMYLIHAANAM